MKLKYFLPLVSLAFMSSAMLTSCDDKEPPQAIIVSDPDAVINQNGASFYWLAFEWEEIKGVNQYGYELVDPEGTVIANGVTDDNRITFTDLLPSTTYTLTVDAYTTNETIRMVLTATTQATTQLDAPVVVAEQVGSKTVVTWNAVENAAAYHYSYLVAGKEVSGETTETTMELAGLPAGSYTFTLYTVAGREGDIDSSISTTTFERIKLLQWSMPGTYISALLGESWEATIHSYDDGTYTIEKWYGVEGYDLEFSVNDDGTINIDNGTLDEVGYYNVKTGNSKVSRVSIWPYADSDGSYSSFEGTMPYGDVWFYAYGSNGAADYDEFTWGSQISVDDICREWNIYSLRLYDLGWFDEYNGNWNFLELEDIPVTIEKVDDTHILIYGLLGDEDVLEATVDMQTLTINIPPQHFSIEDDNSYIFCHEAEAWDGDYTVGVTGTISENLDKISIDDWTVIYQYDDPDSEDWMFFCYATLRME